MVFRCGRGVIAGLSIAVACAACGDDATKKDGAIDTPVDTDNGMCATDVLFTGELVDWDNPTAFCGLFMATLSVHGDASRVSPPTAPNGRFKLCLAPAAKTQVDITEPTGNSPCLVPAQTYTIPAIAVADMAVIQGGGTFSGRSWTTTRQTSFFQLIGQTFDPAKAQVFVHVNGTPRAVSLAATHGAPWVSSSTGWAAGDTGADVFFPNVDVGAGTTSLSVAGGAIGTGSIPVVAGTITNGSVIAN